MWRLLEDRRRTTYQILIVVWLIVSDYAIAHDQVIVRVAPEHFTIYHDPLWGIQTPWLLAAAYAFRASFIGLFLGIALVLAGRGGDWPKLTPRQLYLGTLMVILATESCAVLSGLWAYWKEGPLYPSMFYPDPSLPMLVTATVQVTCYLASAIFSGALIVWCLVRRRRSAKLASISLVGSE